MKTACKLSKMMAERSPPSLAAKSLCSLRRQLLLKALATILVATKADRTIFHDDRLLEVVDILAHFSFDHLLELVCHGPCALIA